MEDDDVNIRILADMIFDEQAQQKMIERNITIPNCIQGKDFSERIQSVMFIRNQITAHRWRTFFDTCYKMMLSSHEMFLTFVMFACISEDKCQKNTFESFLSACALVKILCDETLQKTGVNFYHFNSDIVMVFYRCHLKTFFRRRGGFRRFVEYIRGHRYLSWKLNKDYFASPKGVKAYLDEKITKELKRDRVIEKKTDPDEVARNASSWALAKGVLSTSLAELPTLPSKRYLLNNMIAYKKREKVEMAEEKRTEAVYKSEDLNTASNECSSSKSKTNHDVKHQENIERYNNIIQAAIRYNQSKSSSKANACNRMKNEADGALEHLKDTIKSLIEVLDE